MNPDIVSLINSLHSFSPRLLENQTKCAEFIKSIFIANKITFVTETFPTFTPVFTKYELIVDGQNIPCQPTSLVSGKISKDCFVVNSQNDYASYDKPNLNYNGLSDVISRSSHYPIASLAFSRKDLEKVKNATTITGVVELIKQPHTSQNIILGNINNPTNMVFSHFDSLEGGAMDNASGTAASIVTIINHPELLHNNLFILSSDEELSFDEHTYWGKGYREFQKNHSQLFDTVSKIYVVDGLGLTPATVHQQEIEEFFPIENIDKYIPKTFAISCDIIPQWSIYHSSSDTPEKLIPQHLEQSLQLIADLLK